MSFQQDRGRSLMEYVKPCPVSGIEHDWRKATDAPGWKVGDECVRCQACQLKAIDPNAHSRSKS